MTEMLYQIRHALRRLRAHKRYAVLLVLVLGIAIGANGAAFSIVDAVVLRPLPFDQDRRLLAIWENTTFAPKTLASFTDIENWQQAKTFSGVAGFRWWDYTMTGFGEPQKISPGVGVTSNFFTILGAAPALGRVFTPADERQTPGVVLSHTGWMRYFGGDRSVPGRSIAIDGVSHVVLGVMPEEFVFYPRQTVMWILTTGTSRDVAANPRQHMFAVVGRLVPGATAEQGRDELAVIRRGLEQREPDDLKDVRILVNGLQEEFAWLAGNTRPTVLMLQAACVVLLLIAIFNVANLFLARALERRREMSVRRALGAGLADLLRDITAEGIVISAIGCVVGIALTYTFTGYVLTRLPVDLPPGGAVGVNPRVVLIMVAIAMMTAGLVAAVPALTATRLDPADTLKASGRTHSGDRTAQYFRNALTVGEIAMTLVLLVVATTLVGTLLRLQREPVGYDLNNLLSVRVDLPAERYATAPPQQAFVASMLENLSGRPGVRATVLARNAALAPTTVIGRPIPPPDQYVFTARTSVLPNSFDVLGVSIAAGRGVEPSDGPASMRVAVVNEEFARIFFPDGDAVGRQVKWGDPNNRAIAPQTIVGVVRNVRTLDLLNGANWKNVPEIFTPYAQVPPIFGRSLELLARADVDSGVLTASVREAIARVDSSLPVYRAVWMSDWLSEQLAGPRFRAQLVAAFALVSTLLAALGLYAVMMQIVQQRVPEFAVRLALGATPRQVILSSLRTSLRFGGIGALAGLIAMRFVTPPLRSVFQLDQIDPSVLVGMAVLVVLVSIAASALPAWRAGSTRAVQALVAE